MCGKRFYCVHILYSLCLLWSFKSWYVSPLIFPDRLKRPVRFYIFTTPPGLTLGYQSLLPPSLTSCSRCESRVVWTRTRDRWWCTAAPASDALAHFVLWTPASYWFVQSSASEKKSCHCQTWHRAGNELTLTQNKRENPYGLSVFAGSV